MKKIMVVCNKGSFSRCLLAALEIKVDVLVFEINPKHAVSDNFLAFEKKSSSIRDLDAVLFISGETRNEKRMLDLNYYLPKTMVDYCIERNLLFCYLSSLAVFANNNDSYVTLGSKRAPVDVYGETKQKFDDYVCVLRKEKGTRIRCLFPASFYSGNGRSSIERIEVIFKRYSFLFKYIILPGSMSFIERSTLNDEIYSMLLDEVDKDRIVSKEMTIESIWKKVFPSNDNHFVKIPRLPIFLFIILNFFLPKMFSAKLKMVLIGVRYE